MNPFGIIEDEVICKLLIEKWLIVNKIEMVINELLLKGPIISFDIGINLRASGIGKEVMNSIPFQSRIKNP